MDGERQYKYIKFVMIKIKIQFATMQLGQRFGDGKANTRTRFYFGFFGPEKGLKYLILKFYRNTAAIIFYQYLKLIFVLRLFQNQFYRSFSIFNRIIEQVADDFIKSLHIDIGMKRFIGQVNAVTDIFLLCCRLKLQENIFQNLLDIGLYKIEREIAGFGFPEIEQLVG
ncbi:hypothetical protein D3C73_1070570 [compost metagenome]